MRIKDRPFLTREQEQTATADLLVLSHGPLVLKMAKSFSRYGVDIDDLIQEGNIGLIIAARKFDPGMGTRFSTYAQYHVFQRMREAVMNLHSIVRPSTSYKKRATFFKSRPHFDVSMETPLSEGGLTLGDTFVNPDPGADEITQASIDAEILSVSLHEAIGALTPREADIIRRRFLGETREGLNEIGRRHGISKERVRQITVAALEKLRKRMSA